MVDDTYFIIAVTLGAVCACLLLIIVIGIVMFLWLRARRRRQKLLHNLTFDDGTDYSKAVKSAPTSRSSSPRQDKRMSWTETGTTKKATRGVLVRSLTADRIPEFTLPPERVQPRSMSAEEARGDVGQQQYIFSALQQQRTSLGSVRPDLYPIQTTSPSEEDELNAPESAHGRLWYSLLYNHDAGQLCVTLVKVKELPGRGNNNNTRDPFVKMFLLPDERTCRMSKVKKKTLNPVYNETLTFMVPKEEISKRVLRFSVYDVDKRRVRHSLGHVMVNLKNEDLSKGDIKWADLEPTVQATASLGDLQVSLMYIPLTDKIKIGLHKAKNLNRMADYPENMGAYIRIQLFYGHKCHRTKRTLAVTGGAETAFNESLSFSVQGRQLDSCSIVISLMLTLPSSMKTTSNGGAKIKELEGSSRTVLRSKTVTGEADVEYGRVVIGSFMSARGEELAHWQDMIAQPKTITTKWHAFSSGTTPTSSP
ncbi:synaptotagmin-15 [Plakobranchus ocellatus]|uniref:Synaptotagmin-15 n=1 Tax=Plakobranchus ocellatus TaxID=259542 RepID=A0AAV4D2A8_9GAST|nr:synaptotagmin-15 [Plakobranchus ocellatus]